MLFTALSTFTHAPLEKAGKCTVCKKTHDAGKIVFWKNYDGQFGTCRVILCDSKCHQNYDWNYWEARRLENTRRRSRVAAFDRRSF
jgi:hypothetical protein